MDFGAGASEWQGTKILSLPIQSNGLGEFFLTLDNTAVNLEFLPLDCCASEGAHRNAGNFKKPKVVTGWRRKPGLEARCTKIRALGGTSAQSAPSHSPGALRRCPSDDLDPLPLSHSLAFLCGRQPANQGKAMSPSHLCGCLSLGPRSHRGFPETRAGGLSEPRALLVAASIRGLLSLGPALAAAAAIRSLPEPQAASVLELLIHRDGEFQELMKLALNQGKIHHEMQVLEKEVEKRDSDIQRLQKQLKEAEQILATAVYQAKEKLKSIDKARKGAISSEEIIKYAHRISASNAVCAPLTWVPGDPRRPYPTDLEMRSGLLGQMNNPSTNGVNGHLPGDALAAGRLPDVLAPQYPWQSNDMAMNMLPPNHSNDFLLEPPGHNKENEDDVEVMSTDSSSSSSDSD
ncbi:Mediator of RNA polymerase II transcription subunit 4 [Myotis brandtii]|uniref:Mediator of RNA polymerase II transcription subunit 4 n=1 Tax=Myotis brandtii TaxID=109478 RepID=S7MJW8_MYOBR|nr:Mediator of RNA polymerase II transcription subunit 4 [Myotis brandtii]